MEAVTTLVSVGMSWGLGWIAGLPRPDAPHSLYLVPVSTSLIRLLFRNSLPIPFRTGSGHTQSPGCPDEGKCGVQCIVAKACLPQSWSWEPMAGAWHPNTLPLSPTVTGVEKNLSLSLTDRTGDVARRTSAWSEAWTLSTRTLTEA